MVCWREKGNIIRVSEGPFLPKGTMDSDDLLGRSSMGRASVTRSPVFNILSGISGADSPWGGHMSHLSQSWHLARTQGAAVEWGEAGN